MTMNMDHHFLELGEQGFTIFPGHLDADLSARARTAMDALMPPVGSVETKRHDLRPPFEGPVWPELFAKPETIEFASRVLHAKDLRLRDQAIIRTDPQPGAEPKIGWHFDYVFRPEDYEAKPRRYFTQFMECLSTVPTRGAALRVIPGSHKPMLRALAKATSDESLTALRSNLFELTGVDPADGIEVLSHDGDLIVFDPLLIHGASTNQTDTTRYVIVASYYDASATQLAESIRGTPFRPRFRESIREFVPAEFQSLLDD